MQFGDDGLTDPYALITTARRYKRQVFLSLDLSSLRATRGPSISNEQDNAVLSLERAIIEQLDKVLRDESASS